MKFYEVEIRFLNGSMARAMMCDDRWAVEQNSLDSTLSLE